jgi:antitoxin component YwqK of YwqJK toxin-antitoxin module
MCDVYGELVYEGEWKTGKREGQGKMYDELG